MCVSLKSLYKYTKINKTHAHTHAHTHSHTRIQQPTLTLAVTVNDDNEENH